MRQAETKIARLDARRAAALKAGGSTAVIDVHLADERAGLEIAKAASKVIENGEKVTGELKINLFNVEALNKAAAHAAENPQLLLHKIQSNTYKYSWTLVPISTPFLWLLFSWRRDLKMFDHAVFVTYSLCFMMMCGALVVAVATSSDQDGFFFGLAMAGIAIVPPIHMYRQLRQSYQISRLSAVWRTVCLIIFATVALVLCAFVIISLGVTG
jgi:hypothetical protein